jgi:hypothetical protein
MDGYGEVADYGDNGYKGDTDISELLIPKLTVKLLIEQYKNDLENR